MERGLVLGGLYEVTKAFGATVAIQGVSFELRSGEVLALLGENGAGKSTCVKVLAGVHSPTAGHVYLEGQPVHLRSPSDAQRRGIAVMHQHPGLFGDLSIAENVFMGHPKKGFLGLLDHDGMLAETHRLLKIVGLQADPRAPLSSLRTSEQQLVEIAKALAVKAGIMIMDEPTAALSRREVDQLFLVVDDLRKRGVAMMFVGHRMEEIYEVSDRVVVLRDGKVIGEAPVGEMPRDRAIQLMVGRPLADLYPKRSNLPGKVVMAVEGLSRGTMFENVSFTVRSGEILGFGGLVGSGRTEIARVLFGIDQPTAGRILLHGKPVSFATPKDALEAGIAYVSEDRMGQSLVMDFSILTNAVLAVVDQAAPFGFVEGARELALVEPHLNRLRVRCSGYDQPVQQLSGGNQQKVVLSKWLATEPRIFIFDEPTQGVDVQTKAEVHAVIASLAKDGAAIIVISSELPELIGGCDRIIVFREGVVTGEFLAKDATQEGIMRVATAETTVIDPPAGQEPARPDAAPRKPKPAGRSPRRLRDLLLVRREVGLVVAILMIIIPATILNPRMLGVSNLKALSMDVALLSIVTVAQMLVLITRNIDLSVASVISLSAYVSAMVLKAAPQTPIPVAILIACAVGSLCGLINGAIIAYGRIPAIVATLGTLTLFRGFNSLLANGVQISADQVPQAWLDLTTASIFGVPGVVFAAAAIVSAIAIGLRYLEVGRQFLAIGSNPDGSRLIGIPVARRILAAFGFAGLLAGFDGALWASRLGTVDSQVAFGVELTVIASVVVGGVAIRGGSGTVLGALLGTITLLVINNALILVHIDPLQIQSVYGLVILGAISADAYVTRKGHQPRLIRVK
ncbi:MAG: ATP-binding cassette domain-containing protein, partial [Verrucomicrobia bacterium]|nr:ATP-binding cassette domain-containing protein [Verrucomicrobiota bacterium]